MGVYRDLRAKLDAAGVRPSTRRGQNFLLDANHMQFIASAAEAGPSDVVLEVGPGTGLLTRRLAATGCTVLGVELDRGLLPIAQAETAGMPNVFYMQADILAGKNRINPEVTERLAELLAWRRDTLEREGNAEGPALKCVSNLPYAAGTPFVMNAFASLLPWSVGVFLLQLEVAERLVAAPGAGDYGSLSIAAGLAAQTTIERVVPGRAFWPSPKVESAVVRVQFRPPAERAALPWAEIRAVTNAVFGSRRKTLKNALKGLFPDGNAGAVLDRLGLDPGGRGERLAPTEFLALARAI